MPEPPIADWPYVHVPWGRAVLRFHVFDVRAALARYRRWQRATEQAAREASRQAREEGNHAAP